MRTFINILLISFMLVSFIEAGPAAYGVCQTGCNLLGESLVQVNTVAAACYTAAGVTMGLGLVPACSAAQGVCMTMCIAAGFAPTL